VAFIMLVFVALGWPSSCWSSLSCWRGVHRIGVPAAVSVALVFVLVFVLVSSSWHSSCFVQVVSSSWRSSCFVLAVSSSWWCCHAGARAVSWCWHSSCWRRCRAAGVVGWAFIVLAFMLVLSSWWFVVVVALIVVAFAVVAFAVVAFAVVAFVAVAFVMVVVHCGVVMLGFIVLVSSSPSSVVLLWLLSPSVQL
jgi:hypothetical protein